MTGRGFSSLLVVSRDFFSPLTSDRFQTGGAWPTLADIFIYIQTKVKQHHNFSETLFWKLQNGI